MEKTKFIETKILESLEVKKKLLESHETLEVIGKVAELMISVFHHDGKVLFCGNGGSAADAQHIASELSGRFYKDRKPLFAEALHVNTSYLTAVANDYSFEDVYARLVEAMGRKGDILVGISTSGNSGNVVLALKKAKEMGLHTVGLTGAAGGKMQEYCDYCIKVPSRDTPRIQEAHILIGHVLCEIIEKELFSS